MKINKELEAFYLESTKSGVGISVDFSIDEKINIQQWEYNFCINKGNMVGARKRMLILIFFMSQKLNRHF